MIIIIRTDYQNKPQIQQRLPLFRNEPAVMQPQKQHDNPQYLPAYHFHLNEPLAQALGLLLIEASFQRYFIYIKSNRMSQHQQPKRESNEQEPQNVQQQTLPQHQGPKEIQMQQIIKEVNPQQLPQPQIQQYRKSQLEAVVVKNPIYYYVGQAKYNWRLHQLDPTSILDQLQAEPMEFTEELPFENQVQIYITETPIIGTGMNKHIGYTASKRDRQGESNFTRRYTEYSLFRKKLAELWPGVFLPHLPSKTLIGNSDQEIIRNRIKYINHFWRMLSCHEKVYYSQEVALFMNPQTNVEASFGKIQTPSISDILQRYKNSFADAYQYSQKEEFMYKKEQAPVIFQQFENYFGKKKIQLLQFKDSFRRLADLKTKYVRAVSKLNQSLLPQYENVLSNWFNGIKAEEKPSLLDKINRKSRPKSQQQPKKQAENPSEQPPVVVQQQKYTIYSNLLISSEAYKSKLEDTAQQIHNYNSSIWVLYDVIKFQLKDIDTVISAFEQLKKISRQIDYFRRGIVNNKQQLDSISNKKTTIKTFLMGGSEDDKKTKLSNQIQQFQEKLQKYTDLYHIMLALSELQLIKYHRERVEYYSRAVKKSLIDELGIARSIMDFHVFQYQLFGKERYKKLEEMYGIIPQGNNSSNEVEIKEE